MADLFGNRRVPNKQPGFTSFNPYAAGKKSYGAGRPMPNIGPVMNMQGYNERDNKAKARKNAVLRRLKGQDSGSQMKVMMSDLGGK